MKKKNLYVIHVDRVSSIYLRLTIRHQLWIQILFKNLIEGRSEYSSILAAQDSWSYIGKLGQGSSEKC